MTGPTDIHDESALLARRLAAFRHADSTGLRPDRTWFADSLPTAALRREFLAAVERDEQPHVRVPLLDDRRQLDGRYDLIEPIGSGGMGQVWRAQDRQLDREVAIKVLNVIAHESFDVDRLVAREGRLLARLSHPGAARILGCGRDGEFRFLVMELVGGYALDDVIDLLLVVRNGSPAGVRGADLLSLVGPAPPGHGAVVDERDDWYRCSVRITCALLRTLEATHAVDVVHRDLKPGNVRIVGGGAPVLLDFGHGLDSSRQAGSLTRNLFGTPAYAAPEQFRGVDGVGPETDVYQAGVLLYELLLFTRCFTKTTTKEVMDDVCAGRFRRPRAVDANLPVALERCVLRAMERTPAARYPSAAAMREDLETWLRGERPQAASPIAAATTRARSFGRRYRNHIVLSATGLLSGLLVYALLPAGQPALAWSGDDQLQIQVEEVEHLLAFRLVQDDEGVLRCAPVALEVVGSERPAALDCRLEPGKNTVRLHDVGAPAPGGKSLLSSIRARAGDEAAMRAFRSAMRVLKDAQRMVDRDEGDWITWEKMAKLWSGGGRGGDPVGVAAERMREPGSWRQAGLVGQVLRPNGGA
ncbi:MAG TPA: serine/threonine protein kinase [bacterium]|nr:serine/threonine protein kinase [bacterium]